MKYNISLGRVRYDIDAVWQVTQTREHLDSLHQDFDRAQQRIQALDEYLRSAFTLGISSQLQKHAGRRKKDGSTHPSEEVRIVRLQRSVLHFLSKLSTPSSSPSEA